MLAIITSGSYHEEKDWNLFGFSAMSMADDNNGFWLQLSIGKEKRNEVEEKE